MEQQRLGEKMTDGRRSLIPFWFVGFFAVVLLANGALVYFAVNSWTGLETEQPYSKGLAYNRVLETEKQQAALGWRVVLEFAPDDSGEGAPQAGTVILKAADGDGLPLDGARAEIRFIRPTHEGYDRDLILESRGGGLYQAHVELPLGGVWDIRASLRADGNAHRVTQRIVVR